MQGLQARSLSTRMGLKSKGWSLSELERDLQAGFRIDHFVKETFDSYAIRFLSMEQWIEELLKKSRSQEPKQFAAFHMNYILNVDLDV
jgi:hypothetical protein